MNAHLMRNEVFRAYSGESWQTRTMKMSDAQILAIYTRLKEAGKIK